MIMKLTYIVFATILISPSALVAADRVKSDAEGNRYSDRDQMKTWGSEKERLESALKSGHDKSFYRRELERLGYNITAVNYDKPDYLEYEIVKGRDTFEVQIDFDKASQKSTKVDVTTNMWQAESTDRALKDRKKVAYPGQTTRNPERYSERDRRKSWGDEKDRLEKALKTGEEKSFYRRELEKLGYRVTAVNYDKPDYVEYEIVKGHETYEVQIDIDNNSHKATKVDVTTNMWKADATKKALEQTETSSRR